MFVIYFKVLILALVQGVTEFVPVSSSGHLLIFHKLLDFDFVNNLFFDISLHFGTVLALLLFFRKRIADFLNDSRLLAKIFLALIPTVIIGFLVEDYVESLHSVKIIALTLMGGGILMLLAEKLFKTRKSHLLQVKYKDGLWIGLWQSLALIPGVSRSGITIIAGMSRGLKKTVAAEFSFLLAIPLISGITLKKMLGVIGNESMISSWSDYWLLLFGVIMSAIIGYVVLKYLFEFLNKYSLKLFAWYRIILAIILLIFFYK